MRRFFLVLLAVTLASAGVALRGQQPSKPKGAEWPTYGGDLASTRYSPLDQITKENFGKLEIAWRFKTDSMGPRPEFNFQATPLMVDGMVYTTAGTRRAVVALDAVTGEMKWMHSENEGKRGEGAPRLLSGRGLAYWPGAAGQNARIVYVTPGYQMVALDAKTGVPAIGFGKSGIIGAVMLGFGRALGETIAVTMVIGNSPQVTASLFKPQYTMAAVIANEFTEAADELYLHALIEIGLLLFIVTIGVNAISRLLIWSMKKRVTMRAAALVVTAEAKAA